MGKNDKALIIFTKNAEAGRVKTRIAGELGAETALAIHNELVERTAQATSRLNAEIDLHIYYSDRIPAGDAWTDEPVKRVVQAQVPDLGQRMYAAFRDVFDSGYSMAVIIGSDCPYLSADLLHSAFRELGNNELVVGPALDGGFYLLGARTIDVIEFDGIEWGTSTVFDRLMANTTVPDAHCYLLPVLEDVDDPASYRNFKAECKKLNSSTL